MISINNISFEYIENHNVLNKMNLTIQNNEKVTIIGRSGCGKTTLLLLLAGILKPSQGYIEINDELLNDVRKKTGMIFQNGGLFPWKTVYGNCELGLKARGYRKNEISPIIHEVLETLEIIHLKDKYLKDLSGGQKQRASIARTLVLNSDVLLFDEPSASLDAFTKENFQELLINIYHKYKLCSIVVTHDIEEAVYLGQKIIVMKDGKIAEVINNDLLYGNKNAKNTLEFYEKCLEIRKRLE